MADVKKTIEVVFGAVDNLSGSMGDISGSISDLSDPVAELTGSLLKAEATIIAMGIAMTGVAINSAGKWKAGVSELGTLFNASQSQVSDLSDELLQFSRSSTEGLDAITQASYIAISTGTEVSDVAKVLAQAEKLASAGATDLTTSTATLARTMNSYGLEAEKAEFVSDLLFTTVQNGDLTMNTLASSLGLVASTASASGISIEELLSAMAGMTISGKSASESATGLKRLFIELASPSDDLTKALAGVNLEANGLDGVMAQLQKVTGGSQVEMDKLFSSSEAVASALVLANDKAGAFKTALDGMADSAGNTQKAYELMATQIDRVNQNLINNLKATLIDIGTPLLEEYGTAVGGVTEILKGLGVSVKAPNFQLVIQAMETFLTDFGKYTDGIGNALPDAMSQVDFSNLIASFKDLGGEIEVLFDKLFGEELDLTKPEDLSKALQKIVNLISNLTGFTAGVVEEFGPVFDALGQIAEQVSGIDNETAKTAGNIAGAFTLISKFGTGLGLFLIAIAETGASIKDVSDVLIGFVRLSVNGISVLINGALGGLVDIQLAYSKALLSFYELVGYDDAVAGVKLSIEGLEKASKSYSDQVKQDSLDINNAWKQVGDGFSGSATAQVESLKNIGNEFANLSNSAEKSGEKLKTVGDGVENTTGELDKLKNSILPTIDEIEKFVEGTGKAEDAVVTLGDKTKESADNFSYIADVLHGEVLKLTDVAKNSEQALRTQLDQLKKENTSLKEFAVNLDSLDGKTAVAVVNLAIQDAIADAKKFENIVSSLTLTVTGSQDSITSLYQSLAETPDYWDRSQIHKQIKLENEEKSRSLDLQSQLAEEEIRTAKLRNDRLESKEANIQITAEGLEPEIEAFMWKIIEKIKVRAVEDQAEFLLGLR